MYIYMEPMVTLLRWLKPHNHACGGMSWDLVLDKHFRAKPLKLTKPFHIRPHVVLYYGRWGRVMYRSQSHLVFIVHCKSHLSGCFISKGLWVDPGCHSTSILISPSHLQKTNITPVILTNELVMYEEVWIFNFESLKTEGNKTCIFWNNSWLKVRQYNSKSDKALHFCWVQNKCLQSWLQFGIDFFFIIAACH